MCFDENVTTDNPLVTPCDCKGDTRFVHLACLRKWHASGTPSEVCTISTVMASCR